MANVTQSLFPAFGDMLSPSLEQTYAKQFELASRPGDSMQRVSGLISGAGEQFRQGVSGLFGQQPVEFAQRDKLRAITMGLQQQGVDVTTPEGMLQLAQSLEQFPEYAEASLRLRQQAAMMVQQRKQQELANRLTEAKIGAEAAQAAKALREPPAKEDKIKTPPDFAAAGISLGIPSKVNIADYTQDETARIRQQLQKEKESTAKAGVAASDKDLGNATALRQDFLKETKDIDTGLKALYNVQQLLSERSGLADAIAKRQFAKFSGDRDISNKDIQAFGNFGTLGQRLEGILSQFFSGKYSEAQVEEASRIASNLLKNLQQNRSAIEQQYRTQAEASKIEPSRINFVVPSFTAPTAPKERIPVPANIAQAKGWKTGQKVKRGNKTYTFDGTQLIED